MFIGTCAVYRNPVYGMRSRASAVLFLLVVCATVLILAEPWSAAARDADPPWMAPEFTHSKAQDWINTKPLKLADLEGKVILVDFWSYGCWNCYRSFPWLKNLEARFKNDDLIVVGVHSPEFEHEKNRQQVSVKVKEFGLDHPVMIDNDFSYWKAMNNRYWPTFYLIDKAGQVRASYIGETHDGDNNAKAIEQKIVQLLKEALPS